MSDLLTADHAAARLNISERTLRKLRQSGEIAYIALTNRLFRYTTEDCDEYVASRRKIESPSSSSRVSSRRPGSPVLKGDQPGFMALQAARKGATRKRS
ncbi:helix-turn-helix domain-containing protein [Sphingomonas sp. PAMC 26617]|uniref:helix-turn-helix domain-containing protein n=1 Tax=Sphingomonas sp. PAMC 26617 TaxID=1112216 RepID=UPI0012F51B57|nr:helix-turn-helix domain-containing protein [Sphingomonas sp. PAMC 26617]